MTRRSSPGKDHPVLGFEIASSDDIQSNPSPDEAWRSRRQERIDTLMHEFPIVVDEPDVASLDGGPEVYDDFTLDVQNSATQEVETVVGGPYMGLGQRAWRLNYLMGRLSHASKLTGLIASGDTDTIDKYGGLESLKKEIARIQDSTIENMWYGLYFGEKTDEFGYTKSEYTDFSKQVRDKYVGTSKQKNRQELRKLLKPHL